MNFTCDKAKLLAAVTTLSRFTHEDDESPGLDRLLLRAVDGRLIIAGGDGDTSAVTELHATIEHEGELAVPAESLLRTLEGVERARVEVAAKSKGRGSHKTWTVKIAGGGAAFEFTFHDVEQPMLFPEEQLCAPDVDVTALRPIDSGFKGVLAATVYCTSQDSDRVHLMGVFLQIGQKIIRGVATDGHRLASAEAPASPTKLKAGTFEAIMAGRAVSLVLGTKGEVTHLGLVRADRLAMRVGHLLVVTRPVDAKFPPWEETIPKDDGNRLMVSRLELVGACKAAMKLGSSLTAKGISLVMQDSIIRVLRKVEDPPFDGRFDVDARTVASAAPQPWCTTLSPRYLADALQRLAGDRIEIVYTPGVGESGSPDQPLLLRDPAGRTSLIMPLGGVEVVDLEKQAPGRDQV